MYTVRRYAYHVHLQIKCTAKKMFIFQQSQLIAKCEGCHNTNNYNSTKPHTHTSPQPPHSAAPDELDTREHGTRVIPATTWAMEKAPENWLAEERKRPPGLNARLDYNFPKKAWTFSLLR
jgi:hypothetical protein